VIAEGTLQADPEEQEVADRAIPERHLKIAVPKKRTKPDPNRQLVITGATGNNLKNVSLKVPVGLLTCVTGVSGSGKSTLVNDTLYPAAVAPPVRLADRTGAA
jgi:excinuclease ABC subunit A